MTGAEQDAAEVAALAREVLDDHPALRTVAERTLAEEVLRLRDAIANQASTSFNAGFEVGRRQRA